MMSIQCLRFKSYILVQVDLSDESVKISGGGLVDSDYILAQFHLHWGDASTVGSEHWIDGVQYPMEVCISYLVVPLLHYQYFNTQTC